MNHQAGEQNLAKIFSNMALLAPLDSISKALPHTRTPPMGISIFYLPYQAYVHEFWIIRSIVHLTVSDMMTLAEQATLVIIEHE